MSLLTRRRIVVVVVRTEFRIEKTKREEEIEDGDLGAKIR